MKTHRTGQPRGESDGSHINKNEQLHDRSHNEANFSAGYNEEQIDPQASESDVTKEDLEALGPKDLSMDLGDDEILKHRIYPAHFSGEDLDIPGAELDDENERIGEEDEENNSYSIGDENTDAERD